MGTPVPAALQGKRGRGANGGTTPLGPGQQWRRHQGRREKARRLYQGWQRWRKLVYSSEPRSHAWATHERLQDLVADRAGEQAEVAERLCHAAATAAMAHPDPVGAMNQMLNKWEAEPQVAPAWRG